MSLEMTVFMAQGPPIIYAGAVDFHGWRDGALWHVECHKWDGEMKSWLEQLCDPRDSFKLALTPQKAVLW